MELEIAAAELQKALLNCVSHNLRAPLASITGVLDSLLEDGPLLDHATQQELLRSAREEAGRLNRLLRNLLDMTRLEGGAIHIKRQPSDLRDIVSAAVAQTGRGLENGRASIDIPEDIPLIPLDFTLITQALVNIFDNALRHSTAGQPIEVEARVDQGTVRVSVADHGPGIADADLPRVFDKFYSARGGGVGLGLSICKGFIEAHGGTIRAQNREQGGTVITFTLPIEPTRGVR